MRRVHGALLCAALALGCNTIDTRTDSGYTGPRVYSGTRQALSLAKGAFLQLNPPEFVLWVGDSVLSSVADTLLLPLTIPEQSRLNRETVASLRTDVEQPGILRPIEQEEPVRTARRLFRECSSLLVNLDLRVTDCYSILARIEVDGDGGPEQFTGAQYKEHLRKELGPLAGSGRFVRLRKAEFTEHAPNVEIVAERADPETEKRTTLTWVVGPGTDGQWRILEEKGAGFP